MPWKLIDAVMVALSVVAVVASFMGWWRQEFPWFVLLQLAWNLTLMRRRGHVPYPTTEKWLSETFAQSATPQSPRLGTRQSTP